MLVTIAQPSAEAAAAANAGASVAFVELSKEKAALQEGEMEKLGSEEATDRMARKCAHYVRQYLKENERSEHGRQSVIEGLLYAFQCVYAVADDVAVGAAAGDEARRRLQDMPQPLFRALLAVVVGLVNGPFAAISTWVGWWLRERFWHGDNGFLPWN